MRFKALQVRLMILFSLAFLSLLLLLISITNVFFAAYYINGNERQMRNAVHDYVTGAIPGTPEDGLRVVQRRFGGPVLVFGSDLIMLEGIDAGDEENGRPGPQGSRPGREGDPSVPSKENQANPRQGMMANLGITDEMVQEYYEAALASGPGGFFVEEEEMLHYAHILPHGDMILLSKQMGLLREAEVMFDAFILRTSALVYVVGLIIIFFITRHLIKPIHEMVKTTGNMANLDFSQTLEPKGSEETRHLMASINRLAGSLSTTIGELNESNHQLERELSKERSLEKMRRQFVSDVSHELKNPLAMVMGYTDGLIQNIPKTDEARQDYYEIIMDESERMNKLVKDLLDLSGYESGTFTIKPETFAVNDLIADAIERFSYIMDEKTVAVVYNDTNLCELYADRLRVGQVITNILSNAFKHVDNGGTIRIDLEQVNAGLKMTFSNTGTLIPQGALEDVWNSFYQVDTESKGNGLGLAIVRSIVRLHEGTCRVYLDGGYNCFEIIL